MNNPPSRSRVRSVGGVGIDESVANNLVNLESTSRIARMIDRRIHSQLEEMIGRYPAVVLLGPRQVGKTTLALNIGQSRPSLYLDLESPGDRAKLTEAELYLAEHIEPPDRWR